MHTAPIVLTGASSGIGKAVAFELAAAGLPLVMIVREGRKGRNAHAQIVRETGNQGVQMLTADLASLGQVRELGRYISERHERIAAFVSVAGAHFSRRRLSPEGIEMTLAVNHLAPFLLTGCLLPGLTAHGQGRVVITASSLQIPIDLADLNRNRRYDGFRAYGESKLANVLFTFELARRLAGSGVTANCLAPGLVRTALFRQTGGLARLAINAVGGAFMDSPEKAARKVSRLVTDPALAGISGVYFAKDKPAKANALAYDQAMAEKLWAISERLVGHAVERTPTPSES